MILGLILQIIVWSILLIFLALSAEIYLLTHENEKVEK